MDDQLRRRDRRHLGAIGGMLTAGGMLVVLAVTFALLGWGLDTGDSGGYRARGGDLPGWVYLGGVGLIVLVLGIAELLHRLLKGPEKPGRHARADDS